MYKKEVSLFSLLNISFKEILCIVNENLTIHHCYAKSCGATIFCRTTIVISKAKRQLRGYLQPVLAVGWLEIKTHIEGMKNETNCPYYEEET